MIFNDNNLVKRSTCPICDAKTLVMYKKKTRIGDYTSWEHESTMKLLGLESLDSQMRFCPFCFHFFHFPLFEESKIYNENAFRCRKDFYENKYLPGKIYGENGRYSTEWVSKNKEVFLYLNHIFKQLSREFPRLTAKDSIKILDWGGGDGYLVETISLISKKVLNVPCHAYCFDYHEWVVASNSPYFQYVSTDGLTKESPFDIIFICHVLEHVAFPTKLLAECLKHLSKDGIIVAYVPFQQYRALSPQSSLLDYHQQLFSINSLAESLRRSGYRNIKSRLYHLSYRGNKSTHVLATASSAGHQSRGTSLHYVNDIYAFGNVLSRTIWRKLFRN